MQKAAQKHHSISCYWLLCSYGDHAQTPFSTEWSYMIIVWSHGSPTHIPSGPQLDAT